MSINELFWKVSETDRKRGYSPVEEGFICLLCGAVSERGVIYDNGGILCDAEKNISVHIQNEHGPLFNYILNLDKRLSGLSSHQCALLNLFYQNHSDGEIQKQLGIGSASTIRQHRFALKEKERQAKIFTVLMDLLKSAESNKEKQRSPKISIERAYNNIKHALDNSMKETPLYIKPSAAETPDNRENEKIIRRYFPESYFGRLKTLTMKEKNRLIILEHISKNFKRGIKYAEKEINSILSDIYDDYTSIKRYLIDYKFMERASDGSFYWLTERNEKKEGKVMAAEDKKELKRHYKELKKEGGVYQIKNKINNKILLLATANLKTVNGKLMQLRMGSYLNVELQKEWSHYGEESFTVEVLESISQQDDNFKFKLEQLEEKWLEKLNPYGERGYNMPGRKY